MKQINWQDRKIALLGFGSDNQAVLQWLIKHRARYITICDQNSNLKTQISKLPIRQAQGRQLKTKNYRLSSIVYRLGKDYLKNLQQFDIIFRTPGIPYLTPEIQRAKKAGVEIFSQMKLFFDLCPAKIIGVTGTKGKGTTVSLITAILKSKIKNQKSKRKSQISNHKSQIYSGGNIGNPPIEFLDKLTKDDWVVLELSSFQLQDMTKSPDIAVVLDIKSDHLDYHQSEKEYVRAKENIVRWQSKKDYAIINQDYLTSFRLAEISPTDQDYYFSRRKSVDLGCYVEWLSKGRSAHFGRIILRTAKKDYEICRTYDITLRGEHNLENICAAIIASHLAGASIKAIREIVAEFKGLEHRLEYVGEINGVKFYNDSFSTTPETAIAAIRSFSEPIILIVGGSEKGADYSQLAQEITRSTVKTVIAIGVTGSKIIQNLKSKIFNLKSTTKNLKIIQNCKNMREVVRTAFKEAKAGEVVLLSPASASFDMFKNYKDRGEKFKLAVRDLK